MRARALIVAVMSIAACGGGADMMSTVMVDAGRVLQDAGGSLQDAMGSPRADAQADGEMAAPHGHVVLRDAGGDAVNALAGWATPSGEERPTNVDEAVCTIISAWGQDIRPSYHRLSDGGPCSEDQPFIEGRMEAALAPYTLSVEYR